MKKTLILIILVCLSVISCRNTDAGNKSIICKCYIFDMYNKYYSNSLIEISKDSMLYAYTGIQNVNLDDMIYRNVDLTKMRNPFLSKVFEKKRVKLTETEMEFINRNVNSLKNIRYNNPFVISDVYDSWRGVVIAGNRQYVFYELDNKILCELLKSMDSLSPIRLKYRDKSIFN